MSSEPAYRRLTLEGRWQIRALLDADFSMSAIARQLGVAKSTICREINMVRAVKMLQRSLPAGLVRSIATDRGSEFANFREIEALGIDVYFANPHSPWERGANENANGLLREFYPKGSSFTKISQHDLQWKAVWRINNRPRKCLNWKSAQETFAKMSLAVDRARALH